MENDVIGKEVDGYRIQEVLGKGGMGTVYKAEDVNLSRPVALKRINPSQAHRDMFIHRFRSEAKALARIDSSYITGVYALRETDIGLLIVMEYVDGGTLKDRIEEHDGPMPLDEALPILEQILRAFDDAHTAGVIHRDIKPQNILLSTAGTVKVTDFGIAKLRRPDSGETVTQGGQGGTLKYMSPEQVSSIDDVDDRSDLYSIGMTAYEMLAGALPFNGAATDFDIMQRIVKGQIPPPDTYNADLPASLVEWIQTATAKAQADRYQSAEEMLEALQDAERTASVTPDDTSWREEGDGAGAAPSVGSDPAEAPPIGEGETVLADAGGTVLAGDDAADDDTKSVVGSSGETADAPAGADAPPREPPASSEPSPEAGSGSSGSIALVAGLLVVVLAVAGGGYWMWAGSGSEASPPPPTLALTTDPPNATVYVDDRSVGTTPLTDYTLSAGAVAIQVRKDGYEEVDTVLQKVERGSTYVIEGLSLPPKPARLTVTSVPSGATVSYDGKEVGTTPLTERAVEPGSAQVRLEREGAAVERTVRLRPGGALAWEGVELGSTEEEPDDPSPEPATGILSVSTVTPGATLSVDGEVKRGAGSYTVRAGTRQVTCRHPEYGSMEKTIVIPEDASQEIGCYFEQPVTVDVPGSWGNVVLNGENTEEATPQTIALPPGDHRIGLSVERDDALRVNGGKYRIEVGQETQESGSFGGTTLPIHVRPGFQKIQYFVVFTVQK